MGAVVVVAASVIAVLALRLRAQTKALSSGQARSAALNALSERLAGTRGVAATLEAGTRHLADVFESEVAALAPGPDGRLEVRAWSGEPRALSDKDLSVAQWVYTAGRQAGIGSGTLEDVRALYAPLRGSAGTVGVLRVKSLGQGRMILEQRTILESFSRQIALALEADRLQEDARRAELRAETERLRSALLSAVSHDLKTPLAAIIGSASEVLREGALNPTAGSLVENIRNEAERLSHLVNNLIETTRLESGVSLHKESYALEEVVGVALERLSRPLGEREVRADLPEDLPLVPLDAVLMEQVFVNLIENAVRHAPGAGPIEISARREGDFVRVEVADRGPGLPARDLERVFDKFYHGAGGGAGLGLAIARAVVEAHRGTISAANRAGGGAVFRLALPLREGA